MSSTMYQTLVAKHVHKFLNLTFDDHLMRLWIWISKLNSDNFSLPILSIQLPPFQMVKVIFWMEQMVSIHLQKGVLRVK
jgi:hypothetical protein